MQADFRPGVITLDGHGDDWKDIDGFEFSLLPALDPDEDHEFKDGKMTVKVRPFACTLKKTSVDR